MENNSDNIIVAEPISLDEYRQIVERGEMKRFGKREMKSFIPDSNGEFEFDTVVITIGGKQILRDILR